MRVSFQSGITSGSEILLGGTPAAAGVHSSVKVGMRPCWGSEVVRLRMLQFVSFNMQWWTGRRARIVGWEGLKSKVIVVNGGVGSAVEIAQHIHIHPPMIPSENGL